MTTANRFRSLIKDICTRIMKHFTERNMFRVIVDLFVAGTETTTTTLDWAFLYLAEFPHIQKKCHEEIQLVTNFFVRFSTKRSFQLLISICLDNQLDVNLAKRITAVLGIVLYVAIGISFENMKYHKTLYFLYNRIKSLDASHLFYECTVNSINMYIYFQGKRYISEFPGLGRQICRVQWPEQAGLHQCFHHGSSQILLPG